MKSTICTTRTQLKSYGASAYQAKVITKNLQPISKSNQTSIYSLTEVIASIKQYLEQPKTNKKTKESLTPLLSILIDRLNNIVPFTLKKSVNQELKIQK